MLNILEFFLKKILDLNNKKINYELEATFAGVPQILKNVLFYTLLQISYKFISLFFIFFFFLK